MKPLSQMLKQDLVELYEKFNLELPDEPYTKNELLYGLEESNITTETLKKFNGKSEDESIGVEPRYAGVDKGSVVVVMRRKNKSFSYGKHSFSDTKPYVVMTDAEAKELVNSVKGFSIASAEEIKRFYKK